MNRSSFDLLLVLLILKGIVHPKMKILSLITYSPSCRSKPVRLYFTFRIQMNLMKSEN